MNNLDCGKYKTSIKCFVNLKKYLQTSVQFNIANDIKITVKENINTVHS